MYVTASVVPLTIGVTSHRNIDPSQEHAIRRLVRDFFARIARESSGGAVEVVSALAQGGDQLVAEEALAIGFTLSAVLPMRRDEYVVDFVEADVRERFEALCDRARVIELPLTGADTADLWTRAQGWRERRYLEAGLYIASHCHVLLCIWDGKETGGVGGTAQIVQFHLDGIRPPEVERRSAERRRDALGCDMSRVAYHIVCSRDAPDGAPRAPMRPLQIFWRVGDKAIDGAHEVPREFRSAFAPIREFDADRARHPTVTRQSDSVAPGSIDTLFEAADGLALHFQRRVYAAMRVSYTLAAVAGIVFAFYADLPAQDYMIFVFLLLFAAGVSLGALVKHRAWHRKYLDYRALAEGLRVQMFWRRAGLPVDSDSAFAHQNFLAQRDAELAWIRNVMRAAALDGATGPHTYDDASLALVIDAWVGNPGAGGQLAYYARGAARRARMQRITQLFAAVSLAFAIAISATLALSVLQLDPSHKPLLVTALAIVSVVAAVREAYAYRKADKDLLKQYTFMSRLFARARTALNRAKTPTEKREILRALGEAALDEHAQWAVMHRDRPLEHAHIH